MANKEVTFTAVEAQIKKFNRELKALNGAAGPELARLFVHVREFYEEMEVLRKQVGEIKDSLAYDRVPAAFERDGVTTYTLKEGYRVTISPLVRASCKVMEDAIQWMRDNKFDALVKETINASTLSAFAKGEMAEGRELPDSIFNVHVGMNTSMTKVK